MPPKPMIISAPGARLGNHAGGEGRRSGIDGFRTAEAGDRQHLRPTGHDRQRTIRTQHRVAAVARRRVGERQVHAVEGERRDGQRAVRQEADRAQGEADDAVRKFEAERVGEGPGGVVVDVGRGGLARDGLGAWNAQAVVAEGDRDAADRRGRPGFHEGRGRCAAGSRGEAQRRRSAHKKVSTHRHLRPLYSQKSMTALSADMQPGTRTGKGSQCSRRRQKNAAALWRNRRGTAAFASNVKTPDPVGPGVASRSRPRRCSHSGGPAAAARLRYFDGLVSVVAPPSALPACCSTASA